MTYQGTGVTQNQSRIDGLLDTMLKMQKRDDRAIEQVKELQAANPTMAPALEKVTMILRSRIAS